MWDFCSRLENQQIYQTVISYFFFAQFFAKLK